MKHFEQTLPEGYAPAKVVDAKNSKVGVVFTVISLAISFALIAVGWLILFGTQPVVDIIQTVFVDSFLPWLVFFGLYFVYVVLHELTHGLAFKLFTKQKLTFGLTLHVAYCGVPNVYVYRTAALVATLAPFVVFNIVFLVPIFFLGNFVAYQLVFMLLFCVHFGGCVGDLYNTLLYAFVLRDKTTLMRDTGPKQVFYVHKDSPVYQSLKAKGKLPNEAPAPAEAQQ